MRKKVLITGALGKIGSRLAPYLAEDYDLFLADKEDKSGGPTLDILNQEACLEWCEGMDCVIHLAGNPSPAATYEEMRSVNMDGTYHMMASAAEKGVSRFIFASSIHAVKGYSQDVQVKTDSPVRPPDLYGVGKVFGEALGSYFAYKGNMEVIAIRIGGHRSLELARERGRQPKKRQRSTYISERDMNQLMRRCLEAELAEPYLLVHALSENEYKYLDLSDTKRTLGYKPEDDGFVEFEKY